MAGSTRGVIRGKIVGRKTNLGPFSDPFGAQVPVRPSGPSGVTIVATGHTESIVVTWTAPTTHVDGTLIKAGELAYYYVYYHTASGIDITMPASYTAREKIKAERYEFTIPDPAVTMGPYYFVVTAVDAEGNQSTASNEDSATADGQTSGPAVIDDWAGGNIDSVIVGKTRIFLKFELPKTTWYSFSHYKVYYDVNSAGAFSGIWTYLASERIGFMHSGLTETSYYKYKVSIVGEDGTETTGTINDNGGIGYIPNNADQSNILADVIAAQHIIATQDMISRTFYGGIFQSSNFSAGAGAKFDAENSCLTLGGSAAPKFYFDGTNLSLSGALTATSGTIGGFTIGASALTAGSGASAVGMAPGTYPFYAGNSTAASAPFRVTAAGVLTASSATITGSITASSLVVSGNGGALSSIMENLSTGRNMLTNPGFESGNVCWQTGTGRSFEITGGDGSNYYLKITRSGSNVYSYQYNPAGEIRYFEVAPGEVYEYGGSAKSSNGTCSAYLGVVSTDKDLGGNSSDSIISTSLTWESKVNTYTIPAGHRFLAMYVGAYSVDGYAAFDNMFLRRVDYTRAILGGINVVTLSSAGLNVGTAGSIMGGQTAYNTGTGFFMGYSGAAYKLSIGTAAGNKLTWDGSALTITGTITASAGTIGGFTIGSTTLTAGAGASSVGLAPGTYPFYAGSATAASAPFRVTAAGALTATAAYITGYVGATSGTIGGFAIGASALTSGTFSNAVGLAPGTYPFYAGNETASIAPFRVTTAGALTATSATISGVITATSGTIGGFTVSSADGLYSGLGATRVQMKPGSGFWAGATAFGDAPFSVSNAGTLKATSGTVGGFTIGASSLTAGTGSTGIGVSSSTYAFYAGFDTPEYAPFSVTNTGDLRCTDMRVEGIIDFVGVAGGSIACSTTDSAHSIVIWLNGEAHRIPVYQAA